MRMTWFHSVRLLMTTSSAGAEVRVKTPAAMLEYDTCRGMVFQMHILCCRAPRRRQCE